MNYSGFKLDSNDTLPSQISQYINFDLPIPNEQLSNKMHNFPHFLQTQQTYNTLHHHNMQLLFKLFNKLVHHILHSIPIGIKNRLINENQIYQILINGFPTQIHNQAIYQIYKISIQEYLSFQSHLMNKNKISFQNTSQGQVKNFLLLFLEKYLNYFRINYQYQNYLMILKQQTDSNKNDQFPTQQFSSMIMNQLTKTSSAQNFSGIVTNQLIMKANHSDNSSHITNQKFQKRNRHKFPFMRNQQVTKYSYQQPHFYQKNMLIHLYKIITPNHCSLIEKQPYIKKAYQVLTFQIDRLRSIQINTSFHNLQYTIAKQLQNTLTALNVHNQKNGLYYEKQSWMIIIIYIYKFLQNNYDSYRRRILKNICQRFTSGLFKNIENCVRWLENIRPQLRELESVQNFMSRASATVFEIYKQRSKFLKANCKEQLPVFTLVNLSRLNLQRKKVVNIWISGFLSEDMDKQSHWIQLTGLLKNKQIYAVQWESSNIKNLVKFIGKACVDIMTASKMKQELKKKFRQNPFIPAMQTANMLGRYLAQMMVRLFPVQFINITGYSLGSQMIKSCLQRLIQMGRQSLLCSVYMLGGVTDCTQLQNIIRMARYPININNCYTGNDLVLKDVLSLCLPQAKPIGLNPIGVITGHQIINTDCSKDISGHLSYMSKYDVIGSMLGMDKD